MFLLPAFFSGFKKNSSNPKKWVIRPPRTIRTKQLRYVRFTIQNSRTVTYRFSAGFCV
nr:MAG TPA: hypothetical protein [Caudoviricetes sp.]